MVGLVPVNYTIPLLPKEKPQMGRGQAVQWKDVGVGRAGKIIGQHHDLADFLAAGKKVKENGEKKKVFHSSGIDVFEKFCLMGVEDNGFVLQNHNFSLVPVFFRSQRLLIRGSRSEAWNNFATNNGFNRRIFCDE
jgi:hypothetical protein